MYENEVKAFNAYITYLALKRHFTDSKYDYFKYNKKVRGSLSSFEARNDKLLFMKLAKKSDPEKFVLANIVWGKSTWVGDFSDEVYLKWEAHQQAFEYRTMSDIGKMPDKIADALSVRNNQHPLLLKQVLSGEITIDTLCVLETFGLFFEYWDRMINDKIIWPKVREKCNKYLPFMEYEKATLRKKIYQHFAD